MTTGDRPAAPHSDTAPADATANMLAWLEAEVVALKAKFAQTDARSSEDRNQLWQLGEATQRSESGAANVAAQLQIFSDLPEGVRLLRERLERIQVSLGQDAEQTELLARQLRAEMQAEREERGELRRRAEFAEQAALSGGEKAGLAAEVANRVQESLSELNQRLEHADITVSGLEARLAATGEALRRVEDDGRGSGNELERHDRLFGEVGDRIERLTELTRRLQQSVADTERGREEAESLRDRFESMRVDNETAINRVASMGSEHEQMQARFGEFERSLDRVRTRADQHDRFVTELRAAFEDLRESLQRDTEKLMTFQETLRRRQIADMEQEIREIRGHIRAQTESRDG